MNFNDQLDIELLLTEGPMTNDDLNKIDDLIYELERIKAIEQFSSMPGGFHPPNHYLEKIDTEIRKLGRYRRDAPIVSPEEKRERQLAARHRNQSTKAIVVEKLKEISEPAVFSSINADGVDFVQPNGTTSTISLNNIALNPDFVTEIQEFLRNHTEQYLALKNEIAWMKDVGFNPGTKSWELNKWRYMLPLDTGELTGKSMEYDGYYFVQRGSSELTTKYDFTQQEYTLKLQPGLIKNNTIDLEEWTHSQVEELIDTMGPVVVALKQIDGKIESIEKIGNDLINYAMKVSVKGMFETSITAPSSDITNTSSVINIIKKEIRRQRNLKYDEEL